jgi:uncharacterized membrane protein
MLQFPSKKYLVLLGLTTLWIFLVFSPLVLGNLDTGVGRAIHSFFGHVCHQKAERSLFVSGFQLSVCHRCLGVYSGFWLGLITIPFLRSLSKFLQRQPRVLLLCFLPLFVDVLVENTPTSRMLTGLLAGFPVALFVWLAVEQLPASLRLSLRRYDEPST